MKWFHFIFFQIHKKNFITAGPAGPTGATGATGPAGTVAPAAAVADATGQTDIVTQFNQLLANLRAAGLLAT